MCQCIVAIDRKKLNELLSGENFSNFNLAFIFNNYICVSYKTFLAYQARAYTMIKQREM